MSIVRVPFSLTGGGAAAAYVPAGAIWLDGSADYLTKTFSSSGDRDDYTRSVWVKRSGLGADIKIFDTGPDGGNNLESLVLDSSNRIGYTNNDSNVVQYNYVSTSVYRDTTAWINIVVSRSGTTVTIYVNGTALTAFDTATNNGTTNNGRWTYTDQNLIGRYYLTATQYFNGYLAEIIQIDGMALNATSFGEFDTNGNWVPIDPSGLTFGTNGFWLDFADSNDLGKDVSGNANDWTPTSLSAANSTSDRPADKALDNLGNSCTINPNAYMMSTARTVDIISDGNLSYDENGDADASYLCTIAVNSGKWYFEVKNVRPDTYTQWAGVCRINPMKSNEIQSNISGPPYPYVYNSYSGNAESVETGSVAYGNTWRTTNDVVGVALDLDTPAIWFHKNGTWQNGATVGEVEAGTTTNAAFTNITGPVVPLVALNDGKLSYNFGATAFDYTPPTGFKALNTANLPAPTVTDPSLYFNSVLYTGTGAENARTGVGFQPDLVWVKDRDFNTNHQLVDAVRGATYELNTNATNAESTAAQGVKSFDSDGFTLGTDAGYNDSGTRYVAWCLKANGAGSSNTDGTETVTVSAAVHGGFSIITGTTKSTAGSYTYGHGLSRAPALVIHKPLVSGDWHVYSEMTGADKYFYLNGTAAPATSTTIWDNTAPSSTVIYENTAFWSTSINFVTYAFARTPGLIGIGSYTGNGSTDGPYVVIDDGGSGFRPAWLMIKRTDSTNDWVILDCTRSTYNPTDLVLMANTIAAESGAGSAYMDFTANGFKNRATSLWQNASGGTYIYLAFAEYPFGGEGVAQAKAR